MEAEKQLKEPISRKSHPKSGGGNMSFVDNRPNAINQRKLKKVIQRMPLALIEVGKWYYVENDTIQPDPLYLQSASEGLFNFSVSPKNMDIIKTVDASKVLVHAPVPREMPDRYIYHVTTLESLDNIGKFGLISRAEQLKSKIESQGMDVGRGALMENHEEELQKAKKSLIELEKQLEYFRMLEPRIGDIFLGSKSDFVYGTQSVDKALKYVGYLDSRKVAKCVILRWKPEIDDVYFNDVDDPGAVKISKTISKERLEYFIGENLESLQSVEVSTFETYEFKKMP